MEKKHVQVDVDGGLILGEQEHFWKYIGYDECNYTYIPEGKALLKKFFDLGDGPYFVRTHFMFCTGNCHGTYKFGSTNLYTEDDGKPVYDFAVYDAIVDAQLEAGHLPFLELGFMPMDLADPAPLGVPMEYSVYKEKGWSCPPKDYQKWYDLILELSKHLRDRYGAEKISRWRFELWNEPDIFYWSGTPQQYCDLYDYTETALHAVLPEARLSGPAVTGILEKGSARDFLKLFLEHCSHGKNACTGETGTRLDFITFHTKGGGFPFQIRAPKEEPSVERLIRHVANGLEVIRECGYAGKEIVLSEADPDGWAAGGMYDNANMIFRNTEYYASYVAAAYTKLEQLRRKENAQIYPLAWAFLFPGERCFEGTRTFTTQGIQKPIFNLFKLFGKLGTESLQLNSEGEQPEGEEEARADVSGIAVRKDQSVVQVLLYSHHQDRDRTDSQQVCVNVRNLEASLGKKVSQVCVKHWRIDREHSNAYAQWIKEGLPLYPDAEQYASICARQDLECMGEEQVIPVQEDAVSLFFSMPAHSVSLLEIREK